MTDLLQIYQINPSKGDIPGYFVYSTAPYNLEDKNNDEIQGQREISVDEVANQLVAKEYTELVIAIHGYNNSVKGVQNWYQQIHAYANENLAKKNLVFIGYRWSSENFLPSFGELPGRIKALFGALPILLVSMFIVGVVGAVFGLVFFKQFLLILSVFLVSVVTALVILRSIVYFRDSYRANNFAVPDLVELIRQFERSILEKATPENLLSYLQEEEKLVKINLLEQIVKDILKTYWSDKDYWKNVENKTQYIASLKLEDSFDEQALVQSIDKVIEVLERRYQVKLNFISHSMGAFVTTNVIRILSDVFDQRSIGKLNSNDPQKFPSPQIGRVFSLGRLVLVAPDIPVGTITSGRANFLRSSMRRFEEAYLFSSEGDLALRLASTAANYFIYPARTRIGGYRLGNVTVYSKSASTQDGIVNLVDLPDLISNPVLKHLVDYLEIRTLTKDGRLSTLPEFNAGEAQEPVADLFTYFDCTDYEDFAKDSPNKKKRLLSFSLNEPALIKFFVYVKLLLAWMLKIPYKIDVHGGYFVGNFSSKVIYQLAFISFGAFLDSLVEELQSMSPEKLEGLKQSVAFDSVIATLESQRRTLRETKEPNSLDVVKQRLMALAYLAEECKSKQIQTILSPERYQVDILLNRSRSEGKSEILSQNQAT